MALDCATGGPRALGSAARPSSLELRTRRFRVDAMGRRRLSALLERPRTQSSPGSPGSHRPHRPHRPHRLHPGRLDGTRLRQLCSQWHMDVGRALSAPLARARPLSAPPSAWPPFRRSRSSDCDCQSGLANGGANTRTTSTSSYSATWLADGCFFGAPAASASDLIEIESARPAWRRPDEQLTCVTSAQTASSPHRKSDADRLASGAHAAGVVRWAI